MKGCMICISLGNATKKNVETAEAFMGGIGLGMLLARIGQHSAVAPSALMCRPHSDMLRSISEGMAETLTESGLPHFSGFASPDLVSVHTADEVTRLETENWNASYGGKPNLTRIK